MLLHSFALCLKIKIFWFNILSLISEILHIQLELKPLTIILGVSDDVEKLNNFQQCFLSCSLIIAKKLLIMHWKKKEAPTTKMWLSELTNTLHSERIKYTLLDKLPLLEKNLVTSHSLSHISSWQLISPLYYNKAVNRR